MEVFMSDNNNGRDLLAGFIIGGLIGLALGVLFAPKSGKETREEIISKVKEGYEKAVETAGEAIAPESMRDYKEGEELV
jgi:gas vesicle protein